MSIKFGSWPMELASMRYSEPMKKQIKQRCEFQIQEKVVGSALQPSAFGFEKMTVFMLSIPVNRNIPSLKDSKGAQNIISGSHSEPHLQFWNCMPRRHRKRHYRVRRQFHRHIECRDC
uniref:Uncharacterized protein n=1 Tax=Romanomermis culicivorax TaxID=13658 RepID=A0A915KMU4_ROMCU